METQSIVIGVQAGIGLSDDLSIVILGSPNCPNSGGFNTIKFPDGAELMGWDWQSSIKQESHEVLFQLRLRIDDRDKVLLSTHHIGKRGRLGFGGSATMVTKQDRFADPMIIPPEGIVWVYAEGWAEKVRPAGVEVQTALFVHGPVRYVI